ncbi:MAG: exodeoxyribonuclease VII small subunit, partial [Coriobacteriia bacterium]|nr:exodeoxyribonuclease VII small subunit [Coriobacteriia bacterium]
SSASLLNSTRSHTRIRKAKMADERHSFSSARTRLEEIVTQVRKKDTSLEKSLDLLEEGVRLANVCTELSDHTEWRSVVTEQSSDAPDLKSSSTEALATDDEDAAAGLGESSPEAESPPPIVDGAPLENVDDAALEA